MKNKKPFVLVVGSDGLVGNALMSHLEGIGFGVLGTTRRAECVDKDHLYLDFLQDPKKWPCPPLVNIAVITAGVTRLEECRKNPLLSRRVNVEGTLALVNNLVARGVFVIYLSTNQVFDGKSAYRREDDPFSPVTEYGRQKAEAERQIKKYSSNVSIARFAKIVGPNSEPFCFWRKALKNKQQIHPFSDMYMAPLPLFYVVAVLKTLIGLRLPGILQVSASKDISYAEVGYAAADLIGVDNKLVQPVLASQGGYASESVPRHTTLDVTRLKGEIGFEPPEVTWTIEKIFTDPAALIKL